MEDKMHLRSGTLLLLVCLLAASCTPQAQATPVQAKTLTVLAAASLTESFSELGARFEAQNPGVKVAFNFAGSQQLAQQLAQGAPADVFASASPKYMDVAAQTRRVDPNSSKIFAKNRLVLIYPSDNPGGLGRLQDLAKAGLKLDLADSGVPFPQNCFIVKRSYLTEKRSIVVNALKASIEALYLMKRDKSVAREVLKKYLRIDDDSMIDIGYDYYLARHGEGILTLPDRKGIEFVITDAAKTNPKAKGQTPESLKVLDRSVLDEIKKSGFIEKVKG